jgi:hypothetical protein
VIDSISKTIACGHYISRDPVESYMERHQYGTKSAKQNRAKMGLSIHMIIIGVCKVEKQRTVKLMRPERVTWNLCNIFFWIWSRRNDEECKLFHDFIPCNWSVLFFKEASKSKPYLFSKVSFIGVPKYHTLHTNAHTHAQLNGIPKVIPSGVKHDQASQTMHPTYHYTPFQASTFTINHFRSTQEFGPSLVH